MPVKKVSIVLMVGALEADRVAELLLGGLLTCGDTVDLTGCPVYRRLCARTVASPQRLCGRRMFRAHPLRQHEVRERSTGPAATLVRCQQIRLRIRCAKHQFA